MMAETYNLSFRSLIVFGLHLLLFYGKVQHDHSSKLFPLCSDGREFEGE